MERRIARYPLLRFPLFSALSFFCFCFFCCRLGGSKVLAQAEWALRKLAAVLSPRSILHSSPLARTQPPLRPQDF